MARVHAPLMSLDASGSVAKAITFSKWKGRNYVRELVKPHNPKSPLQVGQRAAISYSSKAWAGLGSPAQANWLAKGKSTNISGINAMIKENGQRARQDKPPLLDPTNENKSAEAAPTALAAVAGPKSITVTWTDSAGLLDWGTAIYMHAGGAPTTGPATLIAMVPRGVQKYLVSNLKTGTVYHFKARGFSNDGTFSVDTADVNATPT